MSHSFFSSQKKDHSFWINQTLKLAEKAFEAGEVPVGAIVVLEDRIIGRGFNQRESLHDPTAHAEMIAISQASRFIGDWRLNECKLFVTKEPCPMCAGATLISRIGEVHFALEDPKMGGLGGAISLHEMPQSNHKPQVFSGTLALECKILFQSFFQLKRLANT